MVEISPSQMIKEIDFLYPVTIIQDRYGGTYSGGKWLAFNLDAEDIPQGVSGSDYPCADFWGENTLPVGKGSTPEEALEHLKTL